MDHIVDVWRTTAAGIAQVNHLYGSRAEGEYLGAATLHPDIEVDKYMQLLAVDQTACLPRVQGLGFRV